MKIPKFLEDLSVISKLGDNPGADNGLTAEGLKAKFDEAALKLQGFINDTLIEKINALFSADAPPHEGMNMTGPINMNQNKLGGLADPVEDGDAVNLGFANENYRGSDWLPSVEEIGAALAGYGYGGSTVSLQEDRVDDDTELANALESVYSKMVGKETIFLYWTGYPAGTSGHGWFGILQKSSENNGSLVAWSAYGAGSTIRKAKYSGSWQPLEWENPPMEDGVEYHTTKRYNGKPVYTTCLNLGTLPSSGDKSFRYSTEGSVTELISFEIFSKNADNEQYSWPHMVFSSATIKGTCRQSGQRTFSVRAHESLATFTGKAILEYIKV